MTQQEFQKQMSEMEGERLDKLAPIREEIARLIDQRAQYEVTINELRLKQQAIYMERNKLESAMRRINDEYGQRKRAFVNTYSEFTYGKKNQAERPLGGDAAEG